ncbi:hypothetical protein [Polaribacter sp. HL-MS24]|uniref:hypothetical protein n=1 Tax=Polaribacter sp. HL-MS24 TaxID=3077735 RepID=UPI002934F343|nr:hypothetical protein [Polaribacter sp. HL-MS24]WOC40118.1 hypothetical protein RRF69_10990 [Polaribacter sp. HL-MS24]
MKLKIILICCIFLFTSCLPSDEENVRVGIMFDIANTTDLEHKNIKITIGGMKDGNFVGTESYTLPTIRIRNNDSEAQYIAVDHNRWKPNLSLIKEISDKAYFTYQLEGRQPLLLYNEFESDELVVAEIAKNGVVKSRYGVNLGLNIFEDSLMDGSIHEQDN